MFDSYQNKFVQGLRKEEVKVIEKYLKNHSIDESTSETKVLKLFKTLQTAPERHFTERELSEITGTHGASLRVLKSRLIDKISEAIIQDSYIKDDRFSVSERIPFELRKKLLVFKILSRISAQDNTEFLLNLLEQIIRNAIEYEIYDVLVDTLRNKKHFYGMRYGLHEYNKINEEIEFYNSALNATLFAVDCYYQIILNDTLIRSLNEREIQKYITVSTEKMERDLKHTKSSNVKYYLFIFKIIQYEKAKNYQMAIRLCNEMLRFVSKSKVLYRKDRIGNILNNLALFNMRNNNYRTAINILEKSLVYYVEDSMDYVITKEALIFAQFHNGNYSKVLEICEELSKHSVTDIGKIRKSKVRFYIAFSLFQQGQYREVLKLLIAPLEIEKGKGRWNITIKILSIMTCVELKQFSKASSSLESLRKYVERNAKSKEIKKRDLLIVKLLREIEKNEFEYDPANKNAVKILKQLSDRKGPDAWEHYCPEMIPFDEWIKKR